MTSVTDAVNGNESYAFDAVGNRTSSHLSNTYSYQPFNRLSATQTSTHSYDANGNMASKTEGSKRLSYTWDHENRLSQVWDRKNRVRYHYDALGRRVARYAGAGGSTKYTHDGMDVVLDDDGGTITKYLNGPGIDNKLRSKTGSAVNYFLADHLGSTNGLADANGYLTSQTQYDAFGNATNASFPTRYQFTGREYDPLAKLQFSRARFYDPKLGRFISEDPIGFAGGDVNLYGYVWNNSTKTVDPLGTDGGSSMVLGGGAAVGSGSLSLAWLPPVGIAIAGGAMIYGAWHAGEYIARHPSNPFSHPWVSPDIIRPPLTRPYCQPANRAVPISNWPPEKYPIPLGPYPPQTPDLEEACYEKCKKLLGIGDYGVQYENCFRRCTGRIS